MDAYVKVSLKKSIAPKSIITGDLVIKINLVFSNVFFHHDWDITRNPKAPVVLSIIFFFGNWVTFSHLKKCHP
jgi:hypothetical protein